MTVDGVTCGTEVEDESDMLLELGRIDSGQYSTDACSTNVRIGNLMRSGYNECFDLTLATNTTMNSTNTTRETKLPTRRERGWTRRQEGDQK
eukprot:scaffold42989_cov29-Attheya_sp.AAC.2